MEGSIGAYVQIKADRSYTSNPQLLEFLKKQDYVKIVDELSGKFDLMVLVRAKSIAELNLYVDKIRKHSQVIDTETAMVLKSWKD